MEKGERSEQVQLSKAKLDTAMPTAMPAARQGNHLREIRIQKVTVNMGVGASGDELKKAQQIIEKITGSKSIQTKAKIKQPTWDIRPGLPIGCKVTLRGKRAREFLVDALDAKNNQLQAKNFDRQGNFGFGIKEYIDLPKVKYDPMLGIRGLDVLVTLERKGFRVKKRKQRKKKVGKNHLISKDEAMNFVKEKFGVEIA